MQSATTSTGTPVPTPTPSVGESIGGVIPQWLQFPGWRWVLAALILGFGILLSRYVVRLVGRSVARQFRRQSVAQMVLRLIRLGVVIVALGVAASVVGFVGWFAVGLTVAALGAWSPGGR